MSNDIFRTCNPAKLRFEVLSGCKPTGEARITNCLEEDGIVV